VTQGWGPPGGQTPPPPPGGAPPPFGGTPPPPGGTPPPFGGTPPPFGGTPAPIPQAAPSPPAAPAQAEGTWIGVVLSALLFLGSIAACLVTGIAAAEARESDAVVVSMVTVPTVIAGLFPWIIALLTRKKGTGLAVGAPIGCGCLTWIVSLVSMVVFYVVIWPEL